MNGHIGNSRDNLHPGRRDLCVRLYTEQEWIDWLLGSLTEAKRAEMALHLEACPLCLEHKARWEDMLGAGGESEAMPDAPVAVSQNPAPNPSLPLPHAFPAAHRADALAAEVPSERIRRRLRRRVKMIGWRRRASRLLAARWKWTVSLAAALMVLASVGFGLGRPNQPEAGWDHYVHTYEPEALSVLSKPDTISYPIALGRLEPEGGMVWYNAVSREMLMLVGGLVPDKGQTIRVWIVKEGTRDSLGLLQYHANRAHLYVKDKTLNLDDNLELTIEPVGGRDEADPGPPSTISLDLTGR
ncbi:anti-sigma factor domain-containing protein [Paenibacillus macerans]|uniref:anti-sigma factor domain-containing protein n=1 Tax=Paenibacillus macerans TaxID=44252 RepID=UPI003D31635B